MTEAIFRRPIWKDGGGEFLLIVGITIIVLGFLELIIGAAPQFSTDVALGLSNAAVGAALMGLGFIIVIRGNPEKIKQEELTNLSTWLEGLLTNPDSPLLAHIENLNNIVLTENEALSSKTQALRGEVVGIGESAVKELTALKEQIAKLSESMTALESRQGESIQKELSSLENRMQELPTNKELHELRNEISEILKRVRKIEKWY